MLLNSSDIEHILPQKEPILLIDNAELIPGHSVLGRLYLNPQWDIFRGHFPENPILPGVYIAESMAQAAGLILLTMPGHSGKYPLLLGISQMRFLRPAYPGDTMQLSAELKECGDTDIYTFHVTAYINERKIAAGELLLKLK